MDNLETIMVTFLKPAFQELDEERKMKILFHLNQ